jgi:hypothetical protein
MSEHPTNDYEFLSALTEGVDNSPAGSNPFLFGIKEQNGQFIFDYSCKGEQGTVLIHFIPDGLLAWTTKKSEEAARKALEQEFGAPITENLGDLVPAVALMFAVHFLQSIQGKTVSLLNELDEEATLWLRGVVQSWSSDGEVTNLSDLNKDIERLAKKLISERKQSLKASIALFNAPEREQMKPRYDVLLPVWRKARDTFRNIKDLPAWQGMIEMGFRDHALPSDLIALLSGDPDDLLELSAELRAGAEKATLGGEDYSKASNLALEHAARLCGYKPFQHGPRGLRKQMDRANAAGESAPPLEGPRKRPNRGHPRSRKRPQKPPSQ